MGGHHKNTYLFGGGSEKILKANWGGKVKNLFVLVYMSESQLPYVYVRFYTEQKSKSVKSEGHI